MLKNQWYKYKETLFEYISFADVTMGKGEDKTFFGYNSMLQKPSQVSKSKAFVNWSTHTPHVCSKTLKFSGRS